MLTVVGFNLFADFRWAVFPEDRLFPLRVFSYFIVGHSNSDQVLMLGVELATKMWREVGRREFLFVTEVAFQAAVRPGRAKLQVLAWFAAYGPSVHVVSLPLFP